VTIAGQEVGDAFAQAGFVFDHEDAHPGQCATQRCKAEVRRGLTAT
jgi:hypothetical protein